MNDEPKIQWFSAKNEKKLVGIVILLLKFDIENWQDYEASEIDLPNWLQDTVQHSNRAPS